MKKGNNSAAAATCQQKQSFLAWIAGCMSRDTTLIMLGL